MDEDGEIRLVLLGQDTPTKVDNTPWYVISSPTRLMSRLHDDNLSEDDTVNILLELADLDVTVPALMETGGWSTR